MVFKNRLLLLYSNSDIVFAEEHLLKTLEVAGIAVETVNDLQIGSNRIAEIEKIATSVNAIIVCISKAFLNDSLFEFISVLVQSYGIGNKKWNIVPLLLEKVELPPRFGILVSLDATTVRTRQEAIIRICQEFGTVNPMQAPVGTQPPASETSQYQQGKEIGELRGDVKALQMQVTQMASTLNQIQAYLTHSNPLGSFQPIPIPSNQVWLFVFAALLFMVTILGAAYVVGN